MGEPGQGNAWSPYDEYIVCAEGTRGTETSKYPEEKKERSIPKVAASEIGRAQTEMRASRGSDRIYDSLRLAERPWKDRPERVKAP